MAGGADANGDRLTVAHEGRGPLDRAPGGRGADGRGVDGCHGEAPDALLPIEGAARTRPLSFLHAARLTEGAKGTSHAAIPVISVSGRRDIDRVKLSRRSVSTMTR